MIDQLKGFMQEKLQAAMGPNSLGENETAQAAEEGASSLMESISGLGANGLSSLTGLLSGRQNTEGEGLVNTLKEKLTGVLQDKGMDIEEAKAEAEQRVPELVDGLKEKFSSSAEADRDFDISNLSGMLGGSAGSLLSKAKGLFGK